MTKELKEAAEALITRIETDVDLYDRSGHVMDFLEYQDLKEALKPSREEREYKTITYAIEELQK